MKLSYGKLFAITGLLAVCGGAQQEYAIYQQYDKFLDAYPSVSDDELRQVFAKRVGMKPEALKNLYIKCTFMGRK